MLLSAAGVWLTGVRVPVCWPVGLVSVLLYAWIFERARLYSDALLQLVYAAILCYGWWNWLRAARTERAGAGGGRPPVVRPRARDLLVPALAGAAGALALGAVMARMTDAAVPWLDAALASASLVAQYWTARLYRVNWLLWIAVDAIYVPLYLYRDLPATAALYAGFIGLAAVGWWRWRLSAPASPGAAESAGRDRSAHCPS